MIIIMIIMMLAQVKFLSISHCDHLERLDQSSIALLPLVETITLRLVLAHPGHGDGGGGVQEGGEGEGGLGEGPTSELLTGPLAQGFGSKSSQ